MIKITAKVIMERFNKIENTITDEVKNENISRHLDEMEIRQDMRTDHAKKLIMLGVDLDTIGEAIGLRAEYLEELKREIETNSTP